MGYMGRTDLILLLMAFVLPASARGILGDFV